MMSMRRNSDMNLMDLSLQVPVMLRNGNRGDIHEFNLNRSSGVYCGWCNLYTGWCKNKDTGEKTYLAIKVGLMDGSTNRFEKSFRNEVLFYKIILPKFHKFQKQNNVERVFRNFPRYRDCLLGPDKLTYLYLENSVTAGYIPFDRNQLLNSEHLKMVFRIYGKFHALSFTYKHQHPDIFNEINKDLVNISVCKHKQNDIRCMEAAYLAAINDLDADIIRIFMNVDFEEIVTNARKCNGKYSCFTHVDYRLCKLMFKYDQTTNTLEDVKLTSFQLLCASTPVHDLSTIFYTQAGKPEMDKLDWYLRIYYDSFSEFVQELGGDPEEIYPYAVLKDEWKIYSAGAIVIGVAFWIQKLLDENGLISISNEEYHTKEDYIKFWKERISESPEGDTFQSRATDICKHAVEYGIF